MLLSAGWRVNLEKIWGIRVLSQGHTLPEHVLWVTRCSKTKSGITRGTPKEMYVSAINRYFYRHLERWGKRYGVLSDRYGLHFDNEELPWYDVHPSQLSQEDKRRLGQIIRDRAMREGFRTIVFYAPAPLMSVPYFEMLYFSGLELFYTTRLSGINPGT